MYQSGGALGIPSIPSLAILKCTISGESPLSATRHQFGEKKKERKISLKSSLKSVKTYVVVSCVCKQVFKSSEPIFQSRCPSSDNCSAAGGWDILLRGTTGFAETAPSISEPARKHVKWSCFGTRRQELHKKKSLALRWEWRGDGDRTLRRLGLFQVEARTCR